MENAAKGLMIAGSVLIAVIIIGMMFYFFNHLKEVPKEQEAQRQQEQTAKFNAEYESYDKQLMYGQDVVTLINKAIDNDRKYATNLYTGTIEKEDNFYFIDVQVTVTTPVKAYATQYYEIPEGIDGTDKYVDYTIYPQNDQSIQISGYVNGKGNLQSYQLGTIFAKNQTFNVIADNGNSVTVNSKVEDFFKGFETVRIQLFSPTIAKPIDKFNYTIVDSGFTDFKRMFFKCTGIQYDTTTGRVKQLTFVEVSAPNDTNLNGM